MNNYQMSPEFKKRLKRLAIITIVPTILALLGSSTLLTSGASGSDGDTQGWAFIFLVLTPIMWVVIPLFIVFLHKAKKEARLESGRITEETLYDNQIPDEHTNLGLTYAIASLSLYSFFFCIPGLIHCIRAKDRSKRRRTALTINIVAAILLFIIFVLTGVVGEMIVDAIRSFSI